LKFLDDKCMNKYGKSIDVKDYMLERTLKFDDLCKHRRHFILRMAYRAIEHTAKDNQLKDCKPLADYDTEILNTISQLINQIDDCDCNNIKAKCEEF
jgi:hypothetical protein